MRGAQQRAGGFDPGFSVNDVTVVSFELPAAYDEARSEALLADLTAALRGSPGNAFGFASREPLADALRLSSQRVRPAFLERERYEFLHPDLPSALATILE